MLSKISIIVPCYKVADFLPQCVESLIAQTYKNVEIILVDDGSPDDTGNLCDEYAKKDARVKVIHKPNGGLAAARNTGQDAATGFAMMFVDGDDWVEPTCCERAYRAMVHNDVELVLFDQYVNYPNSQIVQHSFDDGKGARTFDNDQCKQLQARVLNFNGKIAMAFMKLIRMDYLRKYNIRHVDELKQGAEGFVFNIQLFEHLTKAYYLNEPLLHYRYNPCSISRTANINNNMLILRCMEWIGEYIKQNDNYANLHFGLMNRMLYVICTTAITGYFNPYYSKSHSEKVKEFKLFIREPIVREALNHAITIGIGIQRKLILIIIRLKLYYVLEILGYLRRKQLENK